MRDSSFHLNTSLQLPKLSGRVWRWKSARKGILAEVWWPSQQLQTVAKQVQGDNYNYKSLLLHHSGSGPTPLLHLLAYQLLVKNTGLALSTDSGYISLVLFSIVEIESNDEWNLLWGTNNVKLWSDESWIGTGKQEIETHSLINASVIHQSIHRNCNQAAKSHNHCVYLGGAIPRFGPRGKITRLSGKVWTAPICNWNSASSSGILDNWIGGIQVLIPDFVTPPEWVKKFANH